MQILALAAQASTAIVFVNSDSGEGYISVDGNEGDRNNLTLWKNGDTLITNVSSMCKYGIPPPSDLPLLATSSVSCLFKTELRGHRLTNFDPSSNTIVVVHSTGPVLLGNYSDNPNITAILWAGVPGQESGNSIADVLYGRCDYSTLTLSVSMRFKCCSIISSL